MLEALLAGNPDPEQIASFARCRLKRRVPAIKAAVEQHRLRDHHRFLLRQSHGRLRALGKKPRRESAPSGRDSDNALLAYPARQKAEDVYAPSDYEFGGHAELCKIGHSS